MHYGRGRGEKFVQEFVIGFGFISGLFLSININPESLIIEELLKILGEINPEQAAYFGMIFSIIGILILLASILGAYVIGGKVGIIAVFIGFIGGLLYFSIIGWIFVIVAVLLGFIAVD